MWLFAFPLILSCSRLEYDPPCSVSGGVRCCSLDALRVLRYVDFFLRVRYVICVRLSPLLLLPLLLLLLFAVLSPKTHFAGQEVY